MGPRRAEGSPKALRGRPEGGPGSPDGQRTGVPVWKIRARWPVSRVLSPPHAAGDGHSSRASVAKRLVQPTRAANRKPFCRVETRPPPLFGLAPGGVYHAAPVTGGAVRSYRTLSPLPSAAEASEGGLLSVALSLGSPPPGITRHRVPVEPGLSSPTLTGGSGHPAI